jgi:hypothetical protein
VYDALRTRRPFRGPISGEESLTFLKDRAGSLLHEGLVKEFVNMVETPAFDVPLVQPEIGFSDAQEREAVKAGRDNADSSSATPDALAAPEPSAVVDWLGVL